MPTKPNSMLIPNAKYSQRNVLQVQMYLLTNVHFTAKQNNNSATAWARVLELTRIDLSALMAGTAKSILQNMSYDANK
jgi:hypothetical protein